MSEPPASKGKIRHSMAVQEISPLANRRSDLYLDYLDARRANTTKQVKLPRVHLDHGKVSNHELLPLDEEGSKENLKRLREAWKRFKRLRKTRKICRSTCCHHCRHDSSDSDEDYSFFKPRRMKKLEIEELVARLDQAACEISHKIDYKDIDGEAEKWAQQLELEDKLFDESDRPEFKYNWFRKHHRVVPTKHPIYATSYDNHRRLEVRVEEFRFGAINHKGERFGTDTTYGYKQTNESKDSAYWRTDDQVLYGNIALICSVSNFITLPQACFQHGGLFFFFTYFFLTIAVGQPLLFFEMVLGQRSFHGPTGFARLHPYGRGIPYAILFVIMVFGTARSIYLAYCVLYSVLSIFENPADCRNPIVTIFRSFNSRSVCIPYKEYENYKTELINRTNGDESSAFSTELFYREVISDIDWSTGLHSYAYFHWKLVAAMILVCLVSFIPIHYSIVGLTMKTYLRNSLLLPLLLSLLLFWQLCFRGGSKVGIQNFFNIPDDLNFGHIFDYFTAAFEMVLSTLGIGYGYHWVISGNVSMDYTNMYKTSWKICFIVLLFGLVASLVIFGEIGIIASFIEVEDLHKVFKNASGVPYIFYSGALIKSTRTPSVMIFFLIFLIFGMWSQIIIVNVIIRFLEDGQIIKGKKRWKLKHRNIIYLGIILLQLLLTGPYYFKSAEDVLGLSYIFNGTVAAYTVVIAEVIIVLYLYGFPRFVAELHIMSKRKLPAIFQIQIRYIVLPIVCIFTIPLLLNVYENQDLLVEKNNRLGLLYMGLIGNFVPAFVLVMMSIHYDFTFQPNKVNPLAFIFEAEPVKTMAEMRKKYPIREPKFVGKIDAPSQNHRRSVQSELYQVVEHNMEEVHRCQDYVKGRFARLLAFKKSQANWLRLILCILNQRRVIPSFMGLIRRIMLGKKYRNIKIEILFLTEALEQIISLNFVSAVRKLQRMEVFEMLHYMANELLNVTIFRFDNSPFKLYTGMSSSSDSDEGLTVSNIISEFQTRNRARKKALELHRKLIGQLDKSTEEARTLLLIRLKRDLGLPMHEELRVLKYLRRERGKVEREMGCRRMKDSSVIDHFIPISINEGQSSHTFTIFHGVILEGRDHLVLRRLPIPRPTIVFKTKAEILAQNGATYMDKIAQIVVKTLNPNVPKIMKKRNWKNLPKERIKRLLYRVSDMIDDDVYDFLDRYLTCVIVVVPANEKKNLSHTMYLTPRTRRKHEEHADEEEHTPRSRRQAGMHNHIYRTSEYDLVMEGRRRQLADAAFLELEPSDIVFHANSSDSDASLILEEIGTLDVKTSSGSSATLSDEDIASVEALEWIQELPPEDHYVRRTMEILKKSPKKYETMQARDKRLLRENPNLAFWSENETVKSSKTLVLDVSKLKHISARRWKHARSKLKPEFKYSDKELHLHNQIEKEAVFCAEEARSVGILSTTNKDKSSQQVRKHRTYSLISLRHLLSSDEQFKVDIKLGKLIALSKHSVYLRTAEEKLKNVQSDQAFVGFGKVLIVDEGAGKLTSKRGSFGRRGLHPETITLEDSGCVDEDILDAEEDKLAAEIQTQNSMLEV